MFRITLSKPSSYVYLPGYPVQGTVNATGRGMTDGITLVLIGMLRFVTCSGGYTGDRHMSKEYRFVEEQIEIIPGHRHVDPGESFPFQMVLPKEVDWYRVDRESREPLGVEDISLIPTALPPGGGKNKSHQCVDISYELVLRPRSTFRSVSSDSTSLPLRICPARTVRHHNPQLKAHSERFTCHTSRSGSRPFKTKLTDVLKTAPSYCFDMIFSLPQICVLGDPFEFHLELRNGGNLPNGQPAPRVRLEKLDIVLKSRTKLDIGMNFEPKGRGSVTSHVSIFESHVGNCCIPRSLELPRGEQVSIRERGPTFLMSKILSPSFETLGLGLSYSIDVSGELAVAEIRLKFALKRQMVRLLSAWSEVPAQNPGNSPEPDAPPPSYNEAVADLVVVEVR